MNFTFKSLAEFYINYCYVYSVCLGKTRSRTTFEVKEMKNERKEHEWCIQLQIGGLLCGKLKIGIKMSWTIIEPSIARQICTIRSQPLVIPNPTIAWYK